MTAAVVPIAPRPKDARAAARQAKVRAKSRPVVTMTVAVDSLAVCRLAVRLGNGTASRLDMEMAEKLLLALVGFLPPIV